VWLEKLNGDRPFSNVESVHDDNRRLHGQWHGNFARNDWPSLGNCSSSENQFDGQGDSSPHADHQSSVGATTSSSATRARRVVGTVPGDLRQPRRLWSGIPADGKRIPPGLSEPGGPGTTRCPADRRGHFHWNRGPRNGIITEFVGGPGEVRKWVIKRSWGGFPGVGAGSDD
jgi:hypothetical protein